MNKDQFRPRDENEELLGPDVPYLSITGALMYIANCTRFDIAFAVNLVARHRAGIKNIFRYLNGTKDLGLFYRHNKDKTIIGYTNVGYLSDPHNARSHTGFVFLH